MFIVTFRANRGINGYFENSLSVWAEAVKVEKVKTVIEPDWSDEKIKAIRNDYYWKVTCLQNKAGEELPMYKGTKNSFDPVYIVKPTKEDGNWEHFFVTDSRTGCILSKGSLT